MKTKRDYTFKFQADDNFFRMWVSDSVRPEKIELEFLLSIAAPDGFNSGKLDIP